MSTACHKCTVSQSLVAESVEITLKAVIVKKSRKKVKVTSTNLFACDLLFSMLVYCRFDRDC